MKTAIGLTFCAFAALLSLTGCPTSSNDSGITLSGTVTAQPGTYIITNPVTIKVTMESNSYTAQANLTGSGTLTASYSLSNVPVGTYDVVVTFLCSHQRLYGATYTISGTPAFFTTTPGTGSPPYTVTLSASSISISASETIDVFLGNAG